MSARTNTSDTPRLVSDAERVRVRLFGGPIVLVEGQAIKLSKYQSYLVALVFGNAEDGISRVSVIDFLWDEPDGALQRRRLSQLLYGIKQKCGRKIIRDEGGFLLFDVAERSCDLTRVLLSITSQDFHGLGTFRVTDFLSRIQGAPTAAFEHWRESSARRIEDRFTDALLGACAKSEGEANWSELGALLSVADQACPPNEGFLRHSMRHLVMVHKAGRVTGAVSGFAARWERAYGKSWTPEPATSELCRRAEENGRSGRGPVVVASSPPLFGRGAELEFLHTRLTAPKTGPHLIVVMGEAGIGKTRIIDETMRRVPLDGIRALAARGAEFEDCIPLSPIIDVLQQLSEEDLAALGEPWVTVLKGLMPRAHGAPEEGRAAPP